MSSTTELTPEAMDEQLRHRWNLCHEVRNPGALSGSIPTEVLNHHRVVNLIKPDTVVLDIGVGLGGMAQCLNERGCVVDCVDAADVAYQTVQEHCRTFYPAHALSRLPSNHYHLAISHLVAQHMCERNLREQIKQVYRALRPEGIFSLHLAGSDTRPELLNIPGPIPEGMDGAMCRTEEYMLTMIAEVLTPQPYDAFILLNRLDWPQFGTYWYFIHLKKEIEL